MTARSFSGNLIATTNSRQSAKLKDRKQNFTNDRIGPVQPRRFSSSMAATGTDLPVMVSRRMAVTGLRPRF